MPQKRISVLTRLLLVIAAMGLIAVLYYPIWRIELNAPQYPEGLSLQIHANGLRGNVDIINGLNHYIGMKTLHKEDFIEFKVLPFCIIFFSVIFVLVAIINRRRWLNLAFGLFVSFGVIAMIDFWRWEYNYGHNLDPNAAIIVPGMAYQPPLIGFKQLLNFGAYSIPDLGGWIFIGVGVILLALVFFEWRNNRPQRSSSKAVDTMLLLIGLIILNSCNSGPQPLIAGRDNCYLCKMAITDSKHGAELVTKKGKIFKFDDVHCLLSFLKQNKVESGEVKDIYLADYSGDHSLVKARESFLLQGEEIHGPMNGNVIAFKNFDSMKKVSAQMKAISVAWEQLYK